MILRSVSFDRRIHIMKKIILTHKAPAPIGPYSQAVKVGNILYTSGQVGINPENGQLIVDDLSAETKQVMKNLDVLLHEAEMDFEHVVKTTIYLKDMQMFSEVNKIYSSYFKDNFPARDTVQVAGLPLNANVEISFVAYKP